MDRVELLTGNEAAARAVRLSKPQVIPTYPITPQSPMLASIAGDVAAGVLKAEFLNMESDYAAMAAAVGASLGGARVFTATNSQGLLFMAEHLYTASGSRCPIVMAVVNRAISVPHSRYADHNDALAVSRAGWMQLFCEDAQEILETTIQLFKICEDPRVRLPAMLCYESFIHSNTAEGVVVPAAAAVDQYLGQPRVEALLDPAAPRALNPPTPPEWYTEFKFAEQQAMETALRVIPEVGAAYAGAFGTRPRGLIETAQPGGRCVLASMGSIVKTARRAIRELQAERLSVSLLKVRTYRPFPAAAIREALTGAEVIVAVDRNSASGSHGVLYDEIRSALYGMPDPPRVVGVIAGLGGRDVTVRQIKEITRRALKREPPFDRNDEPIEWLGLDRGRVRDESPQARPLARTG
ncbi:MAG: transketolase C-terminal domain-containing protein [candidate division NC10 bacterium]|nr:transketolase C-terminal domain-containing protein [candidate division NC10 bacterium]